MVVSFNVVQTGRLRHRVTIQRLTRTEPGDGTVNTEWTPLDTVWASIEPLRGRELIEAQAFGVRVTHRVRMRDYDGLASTDRLTFNGRVFDIESVLNREERGAELELMCVEAA